MSDTEYPNIKNYMKNRRELTMITDTELAQIEYNMLQWAKKHIERTQE